MSACAPKLGGNDYSAKGVGEISQTFKGTVIAARPIMINSSDGKLGAGALIGGGTGALLGSTVGGGKGRLVTGVLGGLAAGAAGHFLEQKMSEQEGIEYQVQLDQGNTVTIAQGADPKLAVGQRVLVVQSGKDRSRVILTSYRLKKGLEEKDRIGERYGIASVERPRDPLIWIHAASVGETISLIPLIKSYKENYPNHNILLTTTTVTAASIIEQRLSDLCIHQYVPFDVGPWMKIPLVLLNARLSNRTQSPSMAKRLIHLGAPKVEVMANLKFAADPLPVSVDKLQKLSRLFKDRVIWVAASTHAGEEEIAAALYPLKDITQLSQSYLNAPSYGGLELAEGVQNLFLNPEKAKALGAAAFETVKKQAEGVQETVHLLKAFYGG
eukprot:gene18025-18262_t